MIARSRGRIHTPGWLLATASFLTLAMALTWLGAVGPPLDPTTAFWYRTLQRIPGLADVCGDFTWFARSIPAILATIGTAIAVLHRPRSRVTLGASILGVALTVGLAAATTQNAIPWGELHCVSVTQR